MNQNIMFGQIQQVDAKVERMKNQSMASDQELITLRLQMNALVRMFKWIFPLNLIFKRLINKEVEEYKQHLDDRKKEVDKMKKELINKEQPKVIDPKLKIGRNKPCHCGSGKKFKKCCLDKKDDIKIPTKPEEIDAALRVQAQASMKIPASMIKKENKGAAVALAASLKATAVKINK